jgi:hydrogenase/urease accessory protein HupE
MSVDTERSGARALLARSPLLLQSLLIWIVGTLVHAPQALAVGYMSDDYDLVGAAALPSYRLWSAFPVGRGTYFRPLVMATLRLDWLVAAGSPLVHHITNLVLHLANATLVFLICACVSRRRWHALVLSLVFLLHPLVITNVIWISGRTDSLCTLFFLVSVFAFLRLCRTGRRRWIVLSGTALLCALLSKEIAVATPAVLAGVWLLHSPRARVARDALLALTGMTAGFAAILFFQFYQTPDAISVPAPRSLLRGVVAVPVALLWPNEAMALRGAAANHPLLVLIALALMTAAGVWAGLQARKDRALTFSLAALSAMVAAPLLPLLLTSVNPSSRLMYLPLAVICIALGWLLELLPRAGPKLLIACGLALFPMMAGAVMHGKRWVRNAQMTARYCSEFRELFASTTPGRRLLFVTSPDELEDAPLLSTDHAAALHHCVHGRFGYLDLGTLASVALERPSRDASVSVEWLGPKRLRTSVTAPGTMLRFEAPFAATPSIGMVDAQLAVTDILSTGEARSFEATLTAPSDVDLLFFDGRRLVRVPKAPGPDR